MADGNYEFDDLEGTPLTPEEAGDQSASEGARTIVPPPFTHVSPAAETLTPPVAMPDRAADAAAPVPITEAPSGPAAAPSAEGFFTRMSRWFRK